MPKRANIYLKEEDLALWKAIPKKSEWVSRHLSLDFGMAGDPSVGFTKEKVKGKILDTVEGVTTAKKLKDKCPHKPYDQYGQCFIKGCKNHNGK